MLNKTTRKTSLTRSLCAGSLLLAAALGLGSNARAGEEVSRTSNKDKNVIQQPPPREPRFYLDLQGGAEFDIHATKFISNGNAVFTPNALPGGVNLGGATFPAKIQSRDFQSTHDIVENARLNVGYFVLPYLSVFAGFTYSHGNGHERRVGTITDVFGDTAPIGGNRFGVPGAKYDLYASVGDYQAYAGRGGFTLKVPRFVFDLIHAPNIFQPFISASAGGKYLESQEISFYSGTRPRFVDTGYGTLYGNSWVFTAEVTSGVEIAVAKNASLIIESGYGYDTKPKRGSLAGTGVYTGVNDGGDRLYSTVSLGARFKF